MNAPVKLDFQTDTFSNCASLTRIAWHVTEDQHQSNDLVYCILLTYVDILYTQPFQYGVFNKKNLSYNHCDGFLTKIKAKHLLTMQYNNDNMTLS